MLLQPPDEDIKAVLTQKRLAPEAYRRHAPMPSRAKGLVVFFKNGIESLGLFFGDAVKFRQVETGERICLYFSSKFAGSFVAALPQMVRKQATSNSEGSARPCVFVVAPLYSAPQILQPAHDLDARPGKPPPPMGVK